MGTIINKDVQFELLPTNDVLITLTVSTGEAGEADTTTIVRRKVSADRFCALAFPIMYQNYNSWPPNDPDLAKLGYEPGSKNKPNDEG